MFEESKKDKDVSSKHQAELEIADEHGDINNFG